MNGAMAIVEMLKCYNVAYIFGVPGDTSIALYEALYDSRSDITHVMARDERSAAFMADVYARLSGKPGICECPSGAGPLYAIPGIAEANASSIPVILLTSDIPLSGEGKKTITELDCQRLFEPVTKWSYLLKDAKRIPDVIRRAFRIATTGRPGAIHLVFPQEVLNGKIDINEYIIESEPECETYPAYRTRGSRKMLEAVMQHLINAERPVIIAGGGTKYSRAGKEILELAQNMAAPVVTTISGQGIIPDDHELALGVIGDNGFHPHAHKTLEEGDVLLYIGCKLGSVATIKGESPSRKINRTILQIDLDPELLSNSYRTTACVAGDAKLVIKDLNTLLKRGGIHRMTSSWVKSLNHDRKEFWKTSASFLQSDAMPIKPQRIVEALNRRIDSPTIVIADAGTPTPYITRFLKLGDHQSTFIIPRSFGGLGYAIPALVGAHYAKPNARLIGLFGDGSLGMSAGELETVARLNIPCILIHFNNGCFGWIKALQALHSKEKFFSVDFNSGDPTKVATGFGLKAIHIKTPAELDEGLDEAFASSKPIFLDVVSESEVAELPPVYSWLKAAGKKNSGTV
jgi:acetolactate synthase I/II/III large subunit